MKPGTLFEQGLQKPEEVAAAVARLTGGAVRDSTELAHLRRALSAWTLRTLGSERMSLAQRTCWGTIESRGGV